MIPFISRKKIKLLEVRFFTFCGNVGVVTRRDYEEGFWGPDNVSGVLITFHVLFWMFITQISSFYENVPILLYVDQTLYKDERNTSPASDFICNFPSICQKCFCQLLVQSSAKHLPLRFPLPWHIEKTYFSSTSAHFFALFQSFATFNILPTFLFTAKF